MQLEGQYPDRSENPELLNEPQYPAARRRRRTLFRPPNLLKSVLNFACQYWNDRTKNLFRLNRGQIIY